MTHDVGDLAVAPAGSALTALGGPGGPLLDLSGSRNRRRSERLIGWFLAACGGLSIFTTVGIILVLFEQAFEFFLEISIIDFLFGAEWTALFADGEFGVLPLVAGTLVISAIAMLVAVPLGLMSAIYLSEYAPDGVRSVLKPVLEILAGIPTIVYGFFALTFITPDILMRFLDVGPYNALSAGIAVGILILPMVASLSEDAMRAVPSALREGAYALGATKLEVSTRILLPAAFSGVVASLILAASRAIGETMVVAIASGSRPQLTANPREEMQAMTGYIVQVVSGDAVVGTTKFQSLYAVGALLFLMTLAMNVLSRTLVNRFREEYQ
ncbi:MAG: phosphate ABC transporter permease subunit PstC [Thermomicrobiales bacterium]